MDFLMFVIASVVYVMCIHFAVSVREDFNYWTFISTFVLGGVIGWYMESYITGFAFVVVMTFILW